MAKRNILFNNIVSFIMSESNIEREEAKTLAKKAMDKSQKRTKVPICDEIVHYCDNSSNFRTITGACNNLNNPTWGETNTPFCREITVGDYENRGDLLPKEEIKTSSCKYFLEYVFSFSADPKGFLIILYPHSFFLEIRVIIKISTHPCYPIK
jgi:hypothetical protein